MNAIFKPIRPVHMEMPRSRMTTMDHKCRDRDKLGRACRSLFGPVDHSETLKFVERELSQQAMMQTRKWNFDFKNGVPINDCKDARFNWQLIDITFAPKRKKSASPVPEYDISHLYPPSLCTIKRPTVRPPQQQQHCTTEGHKKLNRTHGGEFMMDVQKPITILKEDNSSSSTTMMRKQTLITDFMQAKKRPCELSTMGKKLGAGSSSPIEDFPSVSPTKRICS